MLVLEGVRKDLARAFSLGPITCEVEPGACTVLIGPSGCGKSTLLRLLIGLLIPDAGRVLIEGRELTAGNLTEMRQRMGYVIQDGGLFPHLTATENISLMAKHLRWPATKISERIAELSELSRMPREALQRFPSQLSGGQKQRVGLMRALMLDPDILLMDEPLAALDPIVRYQLREELAGIFKGLGKTVVLVTHDLAEASFLGDRIWLMRSGQIIQSGTLTDLIERPQTEFVTRFVTAQRGHRFDGDLQ